jgi:ribonuclease VapC
MIVDSSAIIAIAFEEPEASRLVAAILAAPRRLIAVTNWLEVMMVVEGRQGRDSANDARILLEELEVRPVPMDVAQLHAAVDVWRRYGKGNHPAALNLGDCCAYAAAISLGEELLFKGSDFSKTDVRLAAW